MKNILKKSFALLLCLCFAFSLAGCSGAKMTEENIIKTVADVQQALAEFDRETLENHVKSTTLEYILNFAKNKEQFAQLGVSIFENLSMEVIMADANAGTVTVKVKNKDLADVAWRFASTLTLEATGAELLSKLDDDQFLDESLATLQQDIGQVVDNKEEIVTLQVQKGKKGLILCFDERAEDAVSGGALGSIKSVIA